MAVAFESDGGVVFAVSANNNAITVTLPATRPTGSVFYLIAWSRLITDTVGTTPSGYTLLTGWPKTSATASGGRLWVYGRVVTSSETAPTIAMANAATGTSGDLWGACIFCYSGIDTTGTLDATIESTPTTTDAAGTTTCTYPALTTTTTEAMIVRFLVRFRDAADTFTETATWNEREDANSTIRTGAQFHLQDKLSTGTPGSQASVTVAPSNTTSSRYLAVTMALRRSPVKSGFGAENRVA